MSRMSVVLLAVWLVVGAGLYDAYEPNSYVWNNDAEALRRVTSSLRTLRAASLFLWCGAGLVGWWLRSWPRGQVQSMGWLGLVIGWALAVHTVDYYLAAERYALWKYQVTNEETNHQLFPTVTAPLLPVVVQDLRNSTESLDTRCALALALGATPAVYAALQAVAEDPRQDPYLKFHCLKSLRKLAPQRFAARLSTTPDSARALYERYELHNP